MIKQEDFTLISVLLSIISGLLGFVLWYIVSVFKKATKLGDKIDGTNNRITRLNLKFIEAQGKQQDNIFKILTNQESHGKEIADLRGSVARTNVVLNQRGENINKILGNTERFNNFMDQTRDNTKTTIEVLKRHQSEIVRLSDELIMIKDKKK